MRGGWSACQAHDKNKTGLREMLNRTGWLCAMLLVCGAAHGELKIDREGLQATSTVAVVGYSFARDEISMYGPNASDQKRRKPIKLTADDHEHIVMHAALNNVLDVFKAQYDIEFIAGRNVVSNSYYKSISKNPSKKASRGMVYPLGYRDLSLKKDRAMQLCEELGVDAVLDIEFTYEPVVNAVQVDSFNIFETLDRVLMLKSELRLIDRNGKVLLSGVTRSEPFSTSDGLVTSEPPVRSYYPSLLVSYLNALKQDLR